LSEELIEWASTFEALGNPTRLGILLVLYGSDITRKRGNCLTFSAIRTIMRIASPSALDYHLKCLLDADLITKTPSSDTPNGRVYPLYRTTQKSADLLDKIMYRTTEKSVDFLEKIGLAEATRVFMKQDRGTVAK
jgi:DNA-binding transcriptional ArsR family regulator